MYHIWSILLLDLAESVILVHGAKPMNRNLVGAAMHLENEICCSFFFAKKLPIMFCLLNSHFDTYDMLLITKNLDGD